MADYTPMAPVRSTPVLFTFLIFVRWFCEIFVTSHVCVEQVGVELVYLVQVYVEQVCVEQVCVVQVYVELVYVVQVYVVQAYVVQVCVEYIGCHTFALWVGQYWLPRLRWN